MPRKHRVLLLALAPMLTLPGAAAPDGGLDALAWLAGCWRGEGGGGRNEECWTPPEGGMMLGVNRVISDRGTQFEFLRIAPEGGGVALLASPGGKPPVVFPRVDGGEGFVVFANPSHDFPQRIAYRRDGDALTVRVEAERDGEWRGFDVVWRRWPAGWPDAPRAGREDLGRQVRDVETAFARTMAERDHAAFSAFLSEEAVFVSAATARGREEVAAQWQKYFEEPQAPFSWRPETVEVLASGTLALSTGPVYDRDGKLVSRFTSIWRQEAPGRWRIVFDRGCPACE